MRPIDADALKSDILKRLGIKAECYLLYQERLVWNVIEAQPTADVVEVVRCKDCNFCNIYDDTDLMLCRVLDRFVRSDFFCQNGERRKDNE